MNPLRVLLAEDDAIIAALLAEILAGLGYDVPAVETTEAGLVSAAAACRPDLMIVDVHLSRGSGILAVEAILRDGPVPYLLMSGSQINMAPANAVILQKPFWESELVQAIERVLRDAAPLQAALDLPGPVVCTTPLTTASAVPPLS